MVALPERASPRPTPTPRWNRDVVVGVGLIAFGALSVAGGFASSIVRSSRRTEGDPPRTPDELQDEQRWRVEGRNLGIALGVLGAGFLAAHFLRARSERSAA